MDHNLHRIILGGGAVLLLCLLVAATAAATLRPDYNPVVIPVGRTLPIITQAPATGWIIVETVPADAVVSVDSVDAGRSPLTVSDLAAGNHTVAVSLSGYRDVEDEVAIPPGGRVPVRYTLVPVTTAAATRTPMPTVTGTPTATSTPTATAPAGTITPPTPTPAPTAAVTSPTSTSREPTTAPSSTPATTAAKSAPTTAPVTTIDRADSIRDGDYHRRSTVDEPDTGRRCRDDPERCHAPLHGRALGSAALVKPHRPHR